MMLRTKCLLALIALATVPACGANMPATDCAANPNLTTRSQVDACRASSRKEVANDAGDARVKTQAPVFTDASVSAASGALKIIDMSLNPKDGGGHG